MIRVFLSLLFCIFFAFSANAQDTTDSPFDVLEQSLLEMRSDPDNTAELNAELDRLLAENRRLQRQVDPSFLPSAAQQQGGVMNGLQISM
ncbi:hypothetical protein AB8615_00140 [Litorimonas sp. RW-G-Af-16]|uniref:hypothetical protein n=1 Tax=Litorimonas sp. RW-G-Af-16 TaxID=3241168 RepID=UPI003AAF4824